MDGTGEADGRTRDEESREGVLAAIGNTPLIELRTLSEATGCRILAKVEFSNPGGCQKDRVAKRIVEEAEAAGLLGGSNQTIVEGTSGSTGISLSLMARARGYKCIIVMPDDQAAEKQEMLRILGAEVQLVRPAAIVNKVGGAVHSQCPDISVILLVNQGPLLQRRPTASKRNRGRVFC